MRVSLRDGRWVRIFYWEPGEPVEVGPVPDLQDPLTLGWLLALVRQAWVDPTLAPSLMDFGEEDHEGSKGLRWVLTTMNESFFPDVDFEDHPSEAALLVRALELAPRAATSPSSEPLGDHHEL